MYSERLISANNLGKCYQMYEKPHERLMQTIFRGKQRFYKDFWALRDISFYLNKGETVGVVGRNGSGKTTLLQLVCGTLLPSEGVCNVSGRVAALLALGAGFNPEYSGKENIHLYASLLGLSAREINGKFDSICEFADIGEFISQPVKKYSSGMFMRLAFSIAIHVEPDILIVDEALAVGDAAFQRKCYARLEVLKKKGMSLLFVSHSGSSIVDLCDRALLLENGRLLATGSPKAIISTYHKLLFSSPSEVERVVEELQNNVDLKDVSATNDLELSDKSLEGNQKAYYLEGMQTKSKVCYESKGALITDPQITTLKGKKVNVLCKGGRYNYTYKVTFDRNFEQVRFGMLFKTVTGVEIGGLVTSYRETSIEPLSSNSQLMVTFSFICKLNPGVYFLNAGSKGMDGSEEIFLHRILDAVMIRVMPVVNQQSTGMVDFEIATKVEALT